MEKDALKKLSLRVINWNISYQVNNPKSKLLKSAINEVKTPSVIALQEVSEGTYQDLCENEILKGCVFSLNYRKPGRFDGKNRALGCLIACVGDIVVMESSVIERAPFPERTLVARLKVADNVFEIVCFHSLTGVAYGRAKSAQFSAISEYLHGLSGVPVVFCGDANEPKIDHYDLDKTVFFNQKGDGGKTAKMLLGRTDAHNLRDAYRIWLESNDKELERIKRYQGEKEKNLDSAPLAVSHIVRGKKKRYDYLFVSPEWSVENVDYRYAKAMFTGSDHAMLVVDLILADHLK